MSPPEPHIRMADEVIAALTDQWSIDREMNKWFAAKNHDDSIWEGSANISPSMLVGFQGKKCNRYIAYKAIGHPQVQVYDIRTRKVWYVGQKLHAAFQEIIKEIYGDRVVLEIPFTIPELQIRGKADAQLDKRKGMEIKFISGARFKQVKKSLSAFPEHVEQVQIYIEGLEWDDCILWYISKDGYHDWVTIRVEPNPVVYNRIRTRILEEVLAPLLRGELPLKSNGSWCNECQYRGDCMQNIY